MLKFQFYSAKKYLKGYAQDSKIIFPQLERARNPYSQPHFEKSHNAENCKRGPFESQQHSLLQNIKKLKEDPLKTLQKFRKKNKK